MSNFKLKHQGKSGLFNTKGEEYDPGIIKIEKPLVFENFIPKKPMKIAEPVPVAEPPAPTIVQKGYKRVFKTPEELGFVPGDMIDKEAFVKGAKNFIAEPADQWGNTDPRAKNMAMVLAKHKRQEEEAKRRESEELKLAMELAEINKKLTRDKAMRDKYLLKEMTPTWDPDDTLAETKARPAINMMKNNSAVPYKLPHQSKTALHNNGGWNNSVVGSSGELTDDERAEAIRLLDSVKSTYTDRDFKRKGRYDRDLKKVVFENIPMSEEDNLAEWDREKGEFYVDFDNKGKAKVLNIPRGDDDIPVQSFIQSLDKSQYRGYIPKPGDLPEDYYDPGLDPNSTLNPFKGYQRIENYRQR